jgi:flagellin
MSPPESLRKKPMAMNSIMTNYGAQVALQALNKTNDALAVTQKRISTGLRVADARDDGAAFAVAERVRGDIAGTTSANEQLGGVKGLLAVTSAALQNVSDSLTHLKSLTVKMGDGNITADQRIQYQSQAAEITANIKSFITDASYNSKNIINTGGTDTKTIINASGNTYTISAYDASANIWTGVSQANTYTSTTARAALTSGGAVTSAINNTLTKLNSYGNSSNYIDNQINFNKSKIDGMEAGIGALVDADLAKESAKLQSLQIRQQLGTQALGIANQAPQSLLSLFR